MQMVHMKLFQAFFPLREERHQNVSYAIFPLKEERHQNVSYATFMFGPFRVDDIGLLVYLSCTQAYCVHYSFKNV